MAGLAAAHGHPGKSDKSSIRCRHIPPDVASLELPNIGCGEDVNVQSDSRSTHNESRSSNNMLTTTKFVSVLGEAWSYLNQPSAVFQPKGHGELRGTCPKEDVQCYSAQIQNHKTSNSSTHNECFGIALRPAIFSPFVVDSNIEHLKLAQRIPFSESCGGSNNCLSLWKHVWAGISHVALESSGTNGLASMGISYDLGRIYRCITEFPFHGLKDLIHLTQVDCKRSDECCPAEKLSPPSDVTPVDVMGRKPSHLQELPEVNACRGDETTESLESTEEAVCSLHAAYSLGLLANLETGNASQAQTSGLFSDYHLKFLASTDFAFGKCQQSLESIFQAIETSEELSTCEDKNMHHNERREFKDCLHEDKPAMKSCPLVQNKPQNVLAKHRHAFAGALAGAFVSLCLHPVDTIKTLIQARATDQMSVHRIVGSIISERGITGLYRGIASNVASSAPISAVYTFTYESVKGSLLPLLPKECHSFAHCAAGGCASIATSFIFTPSERIKQQMQVGSHYRSCWTASVTILKDGGLTSLYAGWGAVLCRNIPHSIIKFYVYESLKQLVMAPKESSAPPNSLQTLMCGAFAGSTAALFTTPFDVVKTRLQTQIPGSLKQYDGVFHALQEIVKQEGLKGVYRGLTPRLVIYMSHGALFFASYEFFKRAFSLDAPQVPAKVADNARNKEDDSISRLPSCIHFVHESEAQRDGSPDYTYSEAFSGECF